MQAQLTSSSRDGAHPALQAVFSPGEASPGARTVPGVTAALGYLAPILVRPYNYMFEPPAGLPRQNCDFRLMPIWIADARAMISAPSIHGHGFALRDAQSAMVDFRDEDAIRHRYYPEAAELATQLTGADAAHVFDHTVRRREAGRPALTFGRDGDGRRPAAVGRVHVDYTETSGRKRFDMVAGVRDLRSPVARFAIVNIWRSIGERVLDTPLAVCDARTVSATDLVAADLHYPDRSGEFYLVQHSARHRWAYFSEMRRDEALAFKQYDSQVSGTARFTPHSAFDLPDIPPDAPLRESIEIRCLVTYH
jgi:hypothetical protein